MNTESKKNQDFEKNYIDSFTQRFDFPSIWISHMFLNPKYPDLLYTVTSSEINPQTIFKPTVLDNMIEEHYQQLQDIDPSLVKDWYDQNVE